VEHPGPCDGACAVSTSAAPSGRSVRFPRTLRLFGTMAFTTLHTSAQRDIEIGSFKKQNGFRPRLCTQKRKTSPVVSFWYRSPPVFPSSLNCPPFQKNAPERFLSQYKVYFSPPAPLLYSALVLCFLFILGQSLALATVPCVLRACY